MHTFSSLCQTLRPCPKIFFTALVALGLGSCAHQTQKTKKTPSSPKNTLPTLTKESKSVRGAPGFTLNPGAPLTLLAATPSSLSWLEPTPPPPGPTSRLWPSKLLALGATRSLHRTAQGLILMNQTLGVEGFITLPKGATWARFEDDVLWAAGPKALWRMSGVNQFTKVSEHEGITSWDVQAGLMAKVEAGVVAISQDGAKRWQVIEPGEGEGALPEFKQSVLFVRPDHVLVILGTLAKGQRTKPRTYISRDIGASWSPSSFEPDRLQRNGTWVWNGDLNCPAILTQEGKAWSSNPDLSKLPGYKDPRQAMLALSHETKVIPSNTLSSSTFPSPPKTEPDKLHQGEETTCLDPIQSNLAKSPAKGDQPPRTSLATPCSGAYCLARRKWQVSDAPGIKMTQLLQDGTKMRPAHLATLDTQEDTIVIEAAPQGCMPKRVLQGRGIHLLVCEAGLWVRQGGQKWVKEIEQLPDRFDPQGIRVSGDGTVVVQGGCEETADGVVCKPSYLRAPEEIGVRGVWAMVDVEGALEVLPANKGQALVLVVGSDARRPSLWLVGPEVGAHVVVPRVKVDSAVRGLKISSQGEVNLAMGDGVKARWHVLMSDGTLTPL